MKSFVGVVLLSFLLFSFFEKNDGAEYLSMPLYWANSESRLSFTIDVQMHSGGYQTSTARLDMGSSIGLTFPDQSCSLGNCHSCPNAQNCKCAPKTSWVMPNTCPDGSSPSSHSSEENPLALPDFFPEPVEGTNREYKYCRKQNLKVKIAGKSMTLSGNTLGDVNYLVGGSGWSCSWSNPGNTGFCGNSPFLSSVYSNVGSKISQLNIKKKKWSFGLTSHNLTNYLVKTGWTTYNHHNGRAVKVIGVNGKSVTPLYATMDTGNSDFLSYCDPSYSGASCKSKSPLYQAQNLAHGGTFSVTLEGGGVLKFSDDSMPNNLKFRVDSYNHDVFALGFLNHFAVSFDDGQKEVYFANP